MPTNSFRRFRSRGAAVAAVLLIAALVPLAADDSMPRWRVLNAMARAALESKNYERLRDALLQLRPLVPGNPRIAYNLAASEAILGHRTAALRALQNLADMGLFYDFTADPDFERDRKSVV